MAPFTLPQSTARYNSRVEAFSRVTEPVTAIPTSGSSLILLALGSFGMS